MSKAGWALVEVSGAGALEWASRVLFGPGFRSNPGFVARSRDASEGSSTSQFDVEGGRRRSPESPIRPFALERYFAVHEFALPYNLSASEFEALSLTEVLDMADPEMRRAYEDMKFGYTQSAGCPRLRAAIADSYGATTADDCLVVVPEEGIYIAMRCLLRAGDRVVCMHPSYQSLHSVARDSGCDVVDWKPGQDGRFGLDELERLVDASTRLIVVNSPHNPTGQAFEAAALERIVELARRHDAYVFCDEMYRGLELEGRPTPPAGCDLDPRVISLAGVSKTLGLPGLRIGWLATRDPELFAACATMKDYTTICSAAPSEVLATIVLRARERLWVEHRRRIEANAAAVEALCTNERAVMSWRPPQAGTIAMARPIGVSTARVVEQAREGEGLLVLSGEHFDFDPEQFRVGLGYRHLPDMLTRLERSIANARS